MIGYKSILFAALLSVGSALSLSAQNSHKVAKSEVLPLPGTFVAERSTDGQTLHLKYDLTHIDRYFHVSKSDLLYLRVVLKPEEQSKEPIYLDSIILAGNDRYKLISRRDRLGNRDREGDPYPALKDIKRVRDFGKKDNVLHIDRVLSLEETPSRSRLVIEADAIGCADCVILSGSEVYASPIAIRRLRPEDINLDFITPEAVVMKHYEEKLESHVTFPVAKYTLLPEFGDNARELRKISDFVNKAIGLEKEGASLRTATLIGYASPEGDATSNLTLSKNRTEALLAYLKRQSGSSLKRVKLSTDSKGENWQGLKDTLLKSNDPAREEVIRLIDEERDVKARKAKLKALEGGKVYARLLRDYYPPLRRTDFALSFEVRPYRPDELEAVYHKNPRLLSHRELYTLIEQKVEKGEDPTELYATAYRIYPKDPISALNYATALLTYRKDATTALRVLDGVRSDKRALLPTALALVMQGKVSEAEALLFRASSSGDEQALALTRLLSPSTSAD